MERVAFKMKLFPGFEDEYKKRHDEIWPELSKVLKDAGVSEYSIFLDEETNTLFGVLNAEDVQKLDETPNNPIVRKWWDFMADIMETNEDNSPVQVSLKEVFYLK